MPRAPLAFPDLVLCAGSVPLSSFAERVAAASAAGFRGISLFITDVARARASGHSNADLRAILDDHGLAVAELDPLMTWLPGQGLADGASEQGREFFTYRDRDFFAAADAIGARSLNAVLFSPKFVEIDAVVEAFAGLCDRAREHGLIVHLEFLPFTQIRDVRVAHEIVVRAGRANGGIMLDSWHHFRSGTPAAAIPAERVTGIQLSDAPAAAEPDLVEETTHRRLLPGEGAIDLPALLSHLARGGCRAPLGVEVFSDALAARPVAEAAKRVADATHAVLARAGLSIA